MSNRDIERTVDGRKSSWTPARRKAQAERLKKQLTDPTFQAKRTEGFQSAEFREKASVRAKKLWGRDDYRSNASNRTRQLWMSDAYRSKVSSRQSEVSRAHWQDESYRQKVITRQKDALSTPAQRKRLRDQAVIHWANPETRKRAATTSRLSWKVNYGERLKNIRRSARNPERLAKIAKATKLRFTDPVQRQLLSEKAKEYWNRPENRARQAKKMERIIQDEKRHKAWLDRQHNHPNDSECDMFVLLTELKVDFDFQYPIGRYVADFKLSDFLSVIEVDGYYHFQPVGIEKDIKRDAFLIQQGYRVLHVHSGCLRRRPDEVLEAIALLLQEDTPEVLHCHTC